MNQSISTGTAKKMVSKFIIAASISSLLVGCAGVPLPAGQENQREFTQASELPYQQAYQIISKQMRACYRVIGLFGNGYDVQSDMDSASQTGRVELFHIGLTGSSKPEDSIFSRTIYVKSDSPGSIITTTGTTPKYVYYNHLIIKSWLKGNDSCGAKVE